MSKTCIKLRDFIQSRDDWALVEEEIERRGLVERYLFFLAPILQLTYYDDVGLSSEDEMKLRRASPEVCAQAWDEMMSEAENEV